MSMIPMPTCMENFLNSLGDEDKAEVIRWINYGRCTEAEILEFLEHSPSNPRAARLFIQQQRDFIEAARDNVIVSTCLDLSRQNNMWIGFAWLSACMALLVQNKALMENAQALVANRPLPEMIFGVPASSALEMPQFIRKTSDKPLPGYVPSRMFEGMWEESDEMFRKRIVDAVKESKP